jgi:thioredoxin
MRKIIPLTLLALAMFYVSSCKSQPSNTPQNNEQAKNEIKESAIVQIEHLTHESFQTKVFNFKGSEYKFLGDKPCIIDFYASWCGPCKMMAPTLQTIANEYKDKITVYKVDVDAQKELAAAFGISSIPTLLFCPQTDKPQMSAGLLSKADLDQAIAEVLMVKK